MQKIKDSRCFDLQLDESTDVSGDAQLLVYCRFSNLNTSKITEHMLSCVSDGVNTTGMSMFSKVADILMKKVRVEEMCK